jgi:hypothetical protein
VGAVSPSGCLGIRTCDLTTSAALSDPEIARSWQL